MLRTAPTDLSLARSLIGRKWSCDRSRFTLLGHRSAIAGFDDTEEIDRAYVPEATDLVRRVTGTDSYPRESIEIRTVSFFY